MAARPNQACRQHGEETDIGADVQNIHARLKDTAKQRAYFGLIRASPHGCANVGILHPGVETETLDRGENDRLRIRAGRLPRRHQAEAGTFQAAGKTADQAMQILARAHGVAAPFLRMRMPPEKQPEAVEDIAGAGAS